MSAEIPLPGRRVSGPSGPQTIELGNPIGEGAFGIVFSAIDLTSKARYAVKFPRLGAFAAPLELQSFSNEIDAAKAVAHANVVRIVHAHAGPPGVPYLVLEYVDGGSLRQLIDESAKSGKQIPADILKTWFADIIDGMTAINAVLLHRDLHPGNILLSDGRLKITDFGLAKVVGAATRTNTFKGGQHMFYMAPEGWQLKTNTIQLDMYAAGIVMFELLTLRFPFKLPADPRDVDGFRDMHFYQAPMASQALRSDIPAGVHQVIARLMAKRPEDRFQSWDVVSQKLAAAWSGSQEGRARPALAGLLQESLKAHQKQTAEALKVAEAHQLRVDRAKVDDHQRDQVIAEIKEFIDDYNQASSVDKIEIDDRGHRLILRSTNAGSVRIDFFPVHPPVALRGGQSFRFAGAVGFDNGAGFNLLLVRATENDLYGRWQSCPVRTNPLARTRHQVEPFCFSTREQMNEIGAAATMMHVYSVEIRDWSIDLLIEFLQEMVKAKGR